MQDGRLRLEGVVYLACCRAIEALLSQAELPKMIWSDHVIETGVVVNYAGLVGRPSGQHACSGRPADRGLAVGRGKGGGDLEQPVEIGCLQLFPENIAVAPEGYTVINGDQDDILGPCHAAGLPIPNRLQDAVDAESETRS